MFSVDFNIPAWPSAALEWLSMAHDNTAILMDLFLNIMVLAPLVVMLFNFVSSRRGGGS
jgi:hypothetical protein